MIDMVYIVVSWDDFLTLQEGLFVYSPFSFFTRFTLLKIYHLYDKIKSNEFIHTFRNNYRWEGLR